MSTKEIITKKLIWRNIFSMRVAFLFFHTVWCMYHSVEIARTQCGNLKIPPRFFRKNFVNVTFLLKSYTVNWFHENFWNGGKINEITTLCVFLRKIYLLTQKIILLASSMMIRWRFFNEIFRSPASPCRSATPTSSGGTRRCDVRRMIIWRGTATISTLATWSWTGSEKNWLKMVKPFKTV